MVRFRVVSKNLLVILSIINEFDTKQEDSKGGPDAYGDQ
jgi:hypothetical protein